MKNLFKSLVTGAFLLAVTSASAGTLYWQVSGATADFDEAWLVAESVSDHSTHNLDGVDAQSDKRSTALTQTELGEYGSDSYLFYVEMVNYSTSPETVTTGYKWTYNELVSSGYVATSALDVSTATAAGSVSNFGSPIPEPSSGLLLLIGGAMLALRRRRQK